MQGYTEFPFFKTFISAQDCWMQQFKLNGRTQHFSWLFGWDRILKLSNRYLSLIGLMVNFELN